MDDPWIGKVLGRYRIDAVLGRGGMGVVYRGHQQSLNRPVAIKLLPPQLALDPEFVQRFQLEAQAIAGLAHENIVYVYDIDQVDGTYFIVMEYVEGRSLREFRGATRLPLDEVCSIGVGVARALECAHQRGVIHRDVKSQNVMITREGKVKLMDFGLARVAGSSFKTQTGAILGTPEYMAPEQARAGEVTPRTDLYALGIMLYEMTTGRLPFTGGDPFSIALRHISEEAPSPRTVDPTIPPWMEQIVLKAIAKDPAERYASAAEMERALLSAGGTTRVSDSEATRFQPLVMSVLSRPTAGSWPPTTPTPVMATPVMPTPVTAQPAGSAAALSMAPTIAAEPSSGGPYSGGPYSGGPSSGGPYSGGPSSGGPYSAGPQVEAGRSSTLFKPASAGPWRWAALAAVVAGLALLAFLFLYRAEPPAVPPPDLQPAGPPVVDPEQGAPVEAATGQQSEDTGAAVPPEPEPIAVPPPPVTPPPPPPPVVKPTKQPVPPPPPVQEPIEDPPPVQEPVEDPPPPSPSPPPSSPQVTFEAHFSCRKVVEFNIDPEEAMVYVDGQRLGVADDWDGSGGGQQWLPGPGVHAACFRHEGYEESCVRIEITPAADDDECDVDTDLREVESDGVWKKLRNKVKGG